MKKKAYLQTYMRKHDVLCGEPVVQFVDKTHVKVVGEISVIVNGSPVYIPQDVTVARGTVEKGKDYAVTLAQDGTIAVEAYDYDTAEIEPTKRILGGFHTICRNVPADYQKPPVAAFGGALHELAGWSEGDILPMSVWAMNFKPTADDPTGMVYAKECDAWIDIYNGSGTIANPKSRFGGTRLHTHTAVEFMTGYGNGGKWLLNDESFWFASVGSNCGTKMKGGAQPNPDTTGAHVDTANNPMISSIGCEECCGLQAQWLGDFSANSGGSWDNTANPTTAFAGGANAFGSHYAMSGYRAVFAGGAWTTGSTVACGPLYRHANAARSIASVDNGSRGSSRSTHPTANP